MGAVCGGQSEYKPISPVGVRRPERLVEAEAEEEVVQDVGAEPIQQEEEEEQQGDTDAASMDYGGMSDKMYTTKAFARASAEDKEFQLIEYVNNHGMIKSYVYMNFFQKN